NTMPYSTIMTNLRHNLVRVVHPYSIPTIQENTLAYINTKLQDSKVVPHDRHRKPHRCYIGQASKDDVFIPNTDDKYASLKRQHDRFRYFEEGPRWTKHGSVKLSCQLWPYRAGIP
ncbi:Uncharacterized protein HZ326_21781, partial [Fusarium oxysporum f. sp. albedinis]